MTPGDPRISFVWEGIERAVAAAQEAAGERDVGIFGGSLTQQHLDAGLLDEIVLHIAPVLLGSGVRLFGDEGAEQVELERVSVGEADQLTDLHFRVRRRDRNGPRKREAARPRCGEQRGPRPTSASRDEADPGPG
jgi:dihydrofolate reductase